MHLYSSAPDLDLDIWVCSQIVCPGWVTLVPSFGGDHYERLALAYVDERRRTAFPTFGADMI